MPRRRLSMVVTAVVLTTFVLSAAAAGARSRSTTGLTLTGPDAAHVGELYTVNGAGFVPGSLVPLEIAEADGCCLAVNMVADEYGRFAYTGEVWATGMYRVRASVPRNGNGRWRVVASWSFEAYP